MPSALQVLDKNEAMISRIIKASGEALHVNISRGSRLGSKPNISLHWLHVLRVAKLRAVAISLTVL